MQITGEEFISFVDHYGKSWFPAYEIVKNSLSNRIGKTKEIMVLERFCPWKDHLFTLESLQKIEPCIKYVLFQDSSNGSWRIQAVPVDSSSFKNRRPLPSHWRGLRDSQLSDISQIPDCVFVHANGFIGGNLTFNGALLMAETALACPDHLCL